MNSNPATTWAYWAGSATPTEAPFRVDKDGHFSASSACIGVGAFPIYPPDKDLLLYYTFDEINLPDVLYKIIGSKYYIIKHYNKRIIQVIPLIIISHSLIIIIYWLASLSIEMNLKIVDFFWIIPIASIVLILPISVSDIGVREGILAYLLGFLGIGYSKAIAFALLFRLIHTSYNLLTGIAWIKKVKIPSQL